MISYGWVISADKKHVLDPYHSGTKQVGLKRYAIPVACSQLHNRFYVSLFEQVADSQRCCPHHRPLVIADIDGIDMTLHQIHRIQELVSVHPFGRRNFTGNNEATVSE
jgi:hypothetical protein